MSSKLKKIIFSGSMLALVLFLSGCVRMDDAGNPTGFFYNFLVQPTQHFLNFIASNGPGGYGLAIIVLTILVRLILLPLTLKQQRTAIEGQIKMGAVKDVIEEIQADMQETNDPQVQQALYDEMQEVYQQVGYNPMSLSGCLPLLIQLPIITMVYQAINLSPEIKNAEFLSINLGEPSTLLAVLAGAVYLVQSLISYRQMPKENRTQTGAMLFMSPVMIFIFSLSTSAGIAIYWIVGGLLSLIQTVFLEFSYKPRIEAEVEAQMEGVEIVRPERPKKEKTLNATERKQREANRNASIFEKKGRRNEGKQDR